METFRSSRCAGAVISDSGDVPGLQQLPANRDNAHPGHAEQEERIGFGHRGTAAAPAARVVPEQREVVKVVLLRTRPAPAPCQCDRIHPRNRISRRK